MIRIHQVSKFFDSGGERTEALRDVTLDVSSGESVALIGRNGAGKTTLLQIIAGVLTPSSGDVSRPKRISSLLELGSGLHPELTGEENLEVSLALAGPHSGLTRADIPALARFADLESELDRPLKHYSDGMKARLSSSVALHSRPDLLVLDEVLAVGDATFQRRVLEQVSELMASGTTVLIATHSVELARWTQRAVWLEAGEVVRDGASARVLDEYEVTSSMVRRYAHEPAAQLRSIGLRPTPVPEGGAVSAEVAVAVTRSDVPLSARLDLRPVVGDSIWMRDPEESPEQRDLNLLGTTPDHFIGALAPGRYIITADLGHIPFTSTTLEASIVLTDSSGSIHDEMSAPIQIGPEPGRPRYRVRIGADDDGSTDGGHERPDEATGAGTSRSNGTDR